MDTNTEKMLYELEKEVETDAKLKTIGGWVEQQWESFMQECALENVQAPTAYGFKEFLANKLS